MLTLFNNLDFNDCCINSIRIQSGRILSYALGAKNTEDVPIDWILQFYSPYGFSSSECTLQQIPSQWQMFSTSIF